MKVHEVRLALLAALGFLELKGCQAHQDCPAFLDRSVRREIEEKRASVVQKVLVGWPVPQVNRAQVGSQDCRGNPVTTVVRVFAGNRDNAGPSARQGQKADPGNVV